MRIPTLSYVLAWFGLVSAAFALAFVFLLYAPHVQYLTVHKNDLQALDRAYETARNCALIAGISGIILTISLGVIIKDWKAYITFQSKQERREGD
jgi:hypothetical protein